PIITIFPYTTLFRSITDQAMAVTGNPDPVMMVNSHATEVIEHHPVRVFKFHFGKLLSIKIRKPTFTTDPDQSIAILCKPFNFIAGKTFLLGKMKEVINSFLSISS